MTCPATPEKMRIAGGPSRRQPRIVATMPATMSGGRSRSDSVRQPIPTPISTAEVMAAFRAGLGLGGRPESAKVTGRRATVLPGHQAAAVAATTARNAVVATNPQGTLRVSTRWSIADSSVGATIAHTTMPTIVPASAASAPTTAPLAKSTSRTCFGVAPVAAKMPSCRSRRCATTANPAAPTSEASRRKTVATENIANASTGRASGRVADWTIDESPLSSRDCAKDGRTLRSHRPEPVT